MKYLFILLLASIILYSCGSDDIVTNNNGNPPNNTVLFSVAELTLTVPVNSGILEDSASYNFTDTTIQTIKVEFNVTSDIDTLANGNWACRVSQRDSTANIFELYEFITDSLDTNITANVDITNKRNVYAMFRLQSTGNISGSSKFIRFRNIKVTKIN